MQKEIEKDDGVDTVSEMCYGGSSGTVRKQCCNLEDCPGDTPDDHIENPIHQRLIGILHEAAKEDIPPLRRRDIALVTKYENAVKKGLKCIPVRNLSELKHVATATALLICEKVGVKTDHTINKKEPFWKQIIE